MKFFITNEEIDTQIAGIKRTIRLSMNGIVADEMAKKGIVYKKNYGVNIPRIKEIAKSYQANHDLAQRLWLLQIRETMILATLLEPVDKFDKSTASEWVKSFNQVEIIEQCCMNLFCKLTYAKELSLDLINSNSFWTQITGIILAARIYKQFDENNIRKITNQLLVSDQINELHFYKATALCLSRFCRNSKEIATYILKEIDPLLQSSSIGQQYIHNEVKQEILFLDIL
jgi:Predicted DNA alkylation repair enzyme